MVEKSRGILNSIAAAGLTLTLMTAPDEAGGQTLKDGTVIVDVEKQTQTERLCRQVFTDKRVLEKLYELDGRKSGAKDTEVFDEQTKNLLPPEITKDIEASRYSSVFPQLLGGGYYILTVEMQKDHDKNGDFLKLRCIARTSTSRNSSVETGWYKVTLPSKK